MAEQTPNLPDDPAEELAEAPPKSSLLAKIKIFAFVAFVIVAECLVAYLYLPSAADTAAMADATLQAEAEVEGLLGQDGQPEDEMDLADQVEVDLEEFSVTSFQPISQTTLRIDFHLWATVNEEDRDDLYERYDDNLNRFRDQVILTVRSADITDLTDAGLGLIKRKILEKTNKILGKPLLRTIIFSDFSFIEQ